MSSKPQPTWLSLTVPGNVARKHLEQAAGMPHPPRCASLPSANGVSESQKLTGK